jgi:hypothetical protein
MRQDPFGVGEVSKRVLPDRMPDAAAAVLPGTAVRAYDESPRKKKVANAARNTAVKVGTGTAVGLGTAGLIRLGIRRTPIRVRHLKLPRGKTVPLDIKRAPIGTIVGGSVGGGASSYAGQKSYKNIKAENKKRRR